MFTGLVQALGTVEALAITGAGRRLTLAVPEFAADLTPGESVAVNGACLTVVRHDDRTCDFEVSPETLTKTNLGALAAGDRVNLERAMHLGDRLGGHLVQGHVDGVGTVVECRPEGEWLTVWTRGPADLLAQMVPKGSVAVDGVSLTLVEVSGEQFSVALIPHTLARTTLGFKGPGSPVNLETDLLAKYVWKSLLHLRPGPTAGGP